ncbi:MAG: DNA repair protein RecN [Brumimicrobium sp.]
MLKKLTVNNFALIQNATIDFERGFTVITGETGSGKSILLGSLKLILGERADYSVIRDDASKTIVEGTFEITNLNLKPFFEENEIDYWDESIIRREINAKGKSRAFINDTPVQLNLLKTLTEKLIHIHSQHHTLELKNKHFQLNLIDTIAENGKNLVDFRSYYKSLNSLQKEVEALENKKSQLQLEVEFNQFQLEELNKLKLDQKNYSAIEQEVIRGEEFEEIKSGYQQIAQIINGENGVLANLNMLRKNIQVNDDKLNELLQRIETSRIELDDIASIAEDDLSDLDLEPGKLNEYINELDAYNSALRKHNLTSQEELISLRNKLSEEASTSDQIEITIEEKKKEIERLRQKTNDIANIISEKRKNIAPKIESEVSTYLTRLKLADATINIELSKTKLNETGHDELAIYFAPNKGMEGQLIEKSASGGELSRLMLVIQYILSKKQQLPTVIFDEIDTGVSGEVALKIGEHLKEMGNHMQLIAITHLPQVASKGTSHIRVEKRDENNTTKTVLNSLSGEERINEIAKLMSGTEINNAAIENAKNLMAE